MATIKDIAREAGVSVASVSRYFNNKELLSKSACDAIEKTVNKYGYVPNSIGRSLRVARSGKILIVLPTLENPMYLKIITAIENECYQYGYTALTCDTHRDAYKERYILSMLENHYADGAILFSSCLSGEELNSLSKKYPMVLCCEQRHDANLSGVSIDDHAAALEATEHLINKGHKNIAMASGMDAYGSTALREQGFCDALKKHGLDAGLNKILRGHYGFNSGMEAVERLSALEEMPTALVCISDAVAIGAMRKALLMGKSLAVVGFDNIALAGVYLPEITSVAQPRTLMGKTAMKMLLELIENPRQQRQKRFLPHQLVERASTLQTIQAQGENK